MAHFQQKNSMETVEF